MIRRRLRTPTTVLVVAGALGLAACEDDPTGLEHTVPVGAELVMNGATIATFDAATGLWTGEMSVNEGDETPHISVHFLDEDDERITPDSDNYLEVVVDDETIAEFEQDTPGEFGGHLHGIVQGETEVVFRFMHGAVGSGHSEFDTQAVVARVN
ncbi:MAG: hypothetical protein WEB90_05345 [Gemmatimonadota bacterium]